MTPQAEYMERLQTAKFTLGKFVAARDIHNWLKKIDPDIAAKFDATFTKSYQRHAITADNELIEYLSHLPIEKT